MKSLVFFLRITIVMMILFSCFSVQVFAKPNNAISTNTGLGNSIAVNSNPSGASIYLDGKLMTIKTNGVITNVPDGIHTVKLSLAGYYDFEDFIDVSSQGQSIVTHTFESKNNNFRIGTKPTGADIYINGEYKGKTDQSIVLTEGKQYQVNLTLEGYYPYSKTFTLSENSGVHEFEGAYHEFVPLPEFGSVRVVTIPGNAEVYIDGNYSGMSDIALQNVRPGSHTVKIIKTGFDIFETTVIVNVEKQEELRFTLHPQDGVLSIDSIPAKGQVYIDGTYAGDTPYTGKTTQGKHTIEVRAYAFETASRMIELDYQGRSEIFDLSPAAPDRIAAAEQKIQENSRFNPEMAKELLESSKQQLASNNYVAAYDSAKKAADIAGDIDQDGIPNWLDIQPNVSNSYLYILPFVVVVLILGAFLIDRKRCSVTPVLDVEVISGLDGDDTFVIVRPTVVKPHRVSFCTIYLDNRFYETLDGASEQKVNLGKLAPGIHAIHVILQVTQNRYGKVSTEKMVSFTVV